LKTILKEYENILRKNYKAMMFIEDDSGSYSVNGKPYFDKLLMQLYEIEKKHKKTEIKWMLHAINPYWLKKYEKTISYFVKNDKIVFLNSPVQSLNNDIIKLMRRPYNVNEVKQIFLRLKKINSNLFIQTQIIFGFPGETQKKFINTLKNAKDILFDDISFVRFCPMENTDASNYSNQITDFEIKKRMNIIKKELKKSKYNLYCDERMIVGYKF